MRDHVAFLLFVGLLTIVSPKGNQGYTQEEFSTWEWTIRWEFKHDDLNKDGYVDREEFSPYNSPEYLERAFKEFDVDGDGKLNYEDHVCLFVAFDGWNNCSVLCEHLDSSITPGLHVCRPPSFSMFGIGSVALYVDTKGVEIIRMRNGFANVCYILRGSRANLRSYRRV